VLSMSSGTEETGLRVFSEYRVCDAKTRIKCNITSRLTLFLIIIYHSTLLKPEQNQNNTCMRIYCWILPPCGWNIYGSKPKRSVNRARERFQNSLWRFLRKMQKQNKNKRRRNCFFLAGERLIYSQEPFTTPQLNSLSVNYDCLF